MRERGIVGPHALHSKGQQQQQAAQVLPWHCASHRQAACLAHHRHAAAATVSLLRITALPLSFSKQRKTVESEAAAALAASNCSHHWR
jgi:hypothetical protein